MGLKNYLKREPIWASMVSLSAASWIGTWLVARGIISHTQASPLTQALAPAISAGILLGAGLVLREFVRPVWAKVEPEVEKWVGEKMPAELPVVTAWDRDVSAALAEASSYGETVTPDAPVYPPQGAPGAPIGGDPVVEVPPAVPAAPGGPQTQSPAKPMAAGAIEPDPLPGAGVVVEGQLAADLGGLT